MSAQKRTLASAAGAFIIFICMSAIASLLVAAALTPTIAVASMLTNKGVEVFDGLPSFLKIDQLAQRTVITALNDDGKEVELATFFAQNREEVGWDDVSQWVKDATVAGEDSRFYEHGGVDIMGTMRAVAATASGKDVQGGSSITQQLVKNVLVQRCEIIIVQTAPNPENVPAEPKRDEYDSDAEYDADLIIYQEAKDRFDAQQAQHDADQTKFDECIENANGVNAERKVREMKYAIGLEKQYSKDQILLKYLNISGFGGIVYGIEAAAQYYYGVPAKSLTIAQAASLMAIVNNPSTLRLDVPSSKTNGADNGYAANKDRRDWIISQMLKYGKISKKQYDEAINTPIEPNITPQARGCQMAGESAFFCDYITWTIKNDPAFGETPGERWLNFQRGGYRILTTLDLGLQQVAHNELTSRVPTRIKAANLGAASVSVQPGTGRILTMVQSRPFSNDPSFLADHPDYTAVNWNTDRAYGGSSGFQPGSVYKLFTLAQWLKDGNALMDSVNASKHQFGPEDFTNSCGPTINGPWKVGNVGGTFAGAQTAYNATRYSINTAFVQMASRLDLCDIKETAEAFGVHRADGNELQSNPSAVIGSNEIAPLTIAAAIAAIANEGRYCSPIAIERITGPDGKEVDPPKSTCSQAVSPKVADAMIYAMRGATQPGGTVQSTNPHDGIPIIGKTGTTDFADDTWVTVASSRVAMATWVGNVSGHSNLRRYAVGGINAAMLRHYMSKPIIKAMNAKFGGDPWPEPDNHYMYGVRVTVPDLRGMSPGAAKQLLASLGFGFQDGGEIDGSLAVGTVESTAPGPGSRVSRGYDVTVYTSNGSLVLLPDVTGMEKDAALAVLASAGFNNIALTEAATNSPSKVGTVLSQSKASDYMKPSEQITLKIGIAPPSSDDDDD